jgi:hypothetical protein
MALKTYDINSGPEKLRVEVVYSLAQCEAHSQTVQFVPIFTNLLAEWQTMFGQHQGLLDKITRAESRVDGCDDDLDIFVDNISAALLLLYNGNRKSDEYKQYFGSKQPNEIKNPILDEELETVRRWIGSLKGSSTPLLKELGARGEALVKSADNAVEALDLANQDYRVFRFTGEYSKFVGNFNATRKSVYGELGKLPHQPEGKNLPGNFADGFFRHERRRNKKVTIDSVQKEIASLESQLAAQKATLEDLKTKEEAQQQENAEHSALEAEYNEAEKAIIEAQKKAAALRGKLKK